MAFYTVALLEGDYSLIANCLEPGYLLATEFPIERGDTLRLEERQEGSPTGRYLFRLVAQEPDRLAPCPDDRSKTLYWVVLVPLDTRPMRQLQLANPEYGTFVYWIEVQDGLAVGQEIEIEGRAGRYTIEQRCTTLPVDRLPGIARVGFAKG